MSIFLFRPLAFFEVLFKQCRPSSDPQNMAFDESLHCLLTEISMENLVKMKPSTDKPLNLELIHPHDKDEQVHWSRKG